MIQHNVECAVRIIFDHILACCTRAIHYKTIVSSLVLAGEVLLSTKLNRRPGMQRDSRRWHVPKPWTHWATTCEIPAKVVEPFSPGDWFGPLSRCPTYWTFCIDELATGAIVSLAPIPWTLKGFHLLKVGRKSLHLHLNIIRAWFGKGTLATWIPVTVWSSVLQWNETTWQPAKTAPQTFRIFVKIENSTSHVSGRAGVKRTIDDGATGSPFRFQWPRGFVPKLTVILL